MKKALFEYLKGNGVDFEECLSLFEYFAIRGEQLKYIQWFGRIAGTAYENFDEKISEIFS